MKVLALAVNGHRLSDRKPWWKLIMCHTKTIEVRKNSPYFQQLFKFRGSVLLVYRGVAKGVVKILESRPLQHNDFAAASVVDADFPASYQLENCMAIVLDEARGFTHEFSVNMHGRQYAEIEVEHKQLANFARELQL